MTDADRVLVAIWLACALWLVLLFLGLVPGFKL